MITNPTNLGLSEYYQRTGKHTRWVFRSNFFKNFWKIGQFSGFSDEDVEFSGKPTPDSQFREKNFNKKIFQNLFPIYGIK